MTNEDYIRQQQLLNSLINEVGNFPEFFNDIIKVGTLGLQNKVKELTEQAMDMETIAVAFSTTMSGKYSEKNQEWIENLLVSKLKKHHNKGAFMNWKSTLETLANKGENND